MSFKKKSKDDCTVYIPEAGSGYVSVLVFYPGIDVGGQQGKTYMPPLITNAVKDWFDKFVIVIPNQYTQKWSKVKKQYEEEMVAAKLQTIDISIGIFSGSGNGNVDIQSNLTNINSLRNLIMMDPSASSVLATNVTKVRAKGTIVYLMYNEGNWGSYENLRKGFKPLAAATEYKEGDVSNYFDNVQSVRYSHMDIPTKMLQFYKEKIESTLSSPLFGINNPPSPLVSPIVASGASGASGGSSSALTLGLSGASGASGSYVTPSIAMNVVFPSNFEIKAREDVPKFTIWIGPIQPEEPVEGFTELFQDDSVGSLSEDQYTNEYVEAAFAGEDEIIEFNAVDDEPMGDYSSTEATTTGTTTTTTTTTETTVSNVTVQNSNIGPGPPSGSKLLTGSGKSWYIGSAGVGIAGHRLKPILSDLQKHLRANGYPTAEIGNNGITRDLIASVYPNSPARAVASLHGAGLAIDVTFKVPGFKWSGIGDNGNLAKDSTLTKVIWNFVKNQGDITWGAQYDKKAGSDPANGVVKGRGVTEYHHFEISSDKIANYWKPYDSDLKAMGFDYKTLNKYGRDSPIYKLMKQLLNSKGIS